MNLYHELTGDWRKLHSEELRDVCSSYYSGAIGEEGGGREACDMWHVTRIGGEKIIQGFGGET
jgi:hypothetical protein